MSFLPKKIVIPYNGYVVKYGNIYFIANMLPAVLRDHASSGESRRRARQLSFHLFAVVVVVCLLNTTRILRKYFWWCSGLLQGIIPDFQHTKADCVLPLLRLPLIQFTIKINIQFLSLYFYSKHVFVRYVYKSQLIKWLL